MLVVMVLVVGRVKRDFDNVYLILHLPRLQDEVFVFEVRIYGKLDDDESSNRIE